jgi:putative ABC transport system permease protein
MAGLAWSQLRFRPVRLITLLLGLVLATSAFTVLTAAAKTSQLRTVGTVSSHFVPAYDILVRPKGARTKLETRTDTVQPNFLSGIYGGITMAQYHRIAQIPGVSVAAPIAMVGDSLLTTSISFPLPGAEFARPGRQLYRIKTTWVSDDGTSRIRQPASYLYVTPNPLRLVEGKTLSQREVLPGHRLATACPFTFGRPRNPFGVAAQSAADCWSKIDGSPPFRKGSLQAKIYVQWSLPVLIAAVDPTAEAKLDGLNHAVVSGSYLAQNAKDSPAVDHTTTFPVLASSSIGMNEYAQTQLQTLADPAATPLMNLRWIKGAARIPGHVVTGHRSTAAQAYRQLLNEMRGKAGLAEDVDAYWSVSPVRYRRLPSGALAPRLTRNPLSVWHTPEPTQASMDNEDNQFRSITVHSHASHRYALDTSSIATPQLVGVFDPAKIAAFDPLSAVPLGAYQPTAATPANAAAKQALGGQNLLPSQNLGGYVSQPANLITTLSALPALQHHDRYSGTLHLKDPISVIRVKVAGVTGPDKVSLARIKEVAQQIALRTHLDVDIVDGASGVATTIDLPAGKFGRPPLTLTEEWVKKGVAAAIITALDKNSVALYLLILFVCALFVANSASATVRARRQEFGVLACLGWTKPRLFATVLGELAMIGLLAGVVGAGGALGLSAGLDLHASLRRAALAVPVAVVVAVFAGLVPAWFAAHGQPISSVRPAVLKVRRAHHPRGITAMAVVNLLRTPGRAVLAATSLAVGIVALTVLAAISAAFHGVLVGSLLGTAVSVQVRGVDYVAAIATITVGVVAVADVIYLNIRERAAELSAIRSFGWSETALGRLVVTEGALVGLIGSAFGATIGLFIAAKIAGALPDRLYAIAIGEIVAGVLITSIAALLPVQILRRLPASHLLAEE